MRAGAERSRSLQLPDLLWAMEAFEAELSRHRDELNSLNVYPVPDGDTGTNMLLTQRAVVAALGASRGTLDAAEVRETISRASLMGARGNSGVILSQILRGLMEAMSDDGSLDGPRLADGLRLAAEEAYRAVARPAEGTVLTVIREAADAARMVADETNGDGDADPGCKPVLRAAVERARASLARTTELLPELARVGVVDAGGKGIVLLLDALLGAVAGEPVSEPVGPLGPVGSRVGDAWAEPSGRSHEVQVLLEAPDHAVLPLREALGELGDSLVVVGGGGLFNVHVHTDEPEAALNLARRAGSLRSVHVVPLAEGSVDCLDGQARAVRVAEQACALVAVADGEGLGRAFRSLGAVVVDGGPGRNPAVGDLLAAVMAAPAGTVAILPNHPNVVPAAERTAEEAGPTKQARVVPCGSIPAGLAAATAFNPLRSLDQNLPVMTEAARRCRAGALAPAERDADTAVGPVRRGEWLAVAEEEPVSVGGPAPDAAVAVVGRLVAEDSEIITVITGAGASEEDRRAVPAALAAAFPGLQVEVLDGGQPGYPFLIGVE